MEEFPLVTNSFLQNGSSDLILVERGERTETVKDGQAAQDSMNVITRVREKR